MASDPIAAVYALLAAWNDRDIGRFVTMLAPDVEWYDLGMLHPPARGRDAVQQFAHAVLAAFPDFQYAVEPPLCTAPDGSRCVVAWRITATHTGVLTPPGLAPTGRRAAFSGVDVIDFRGEEICRIRTLFDVIAAAEQLTGLTLRPPADSARERLFVSLQRLVAFFTKRRSRRTVGRRAVDSRRSPRQRLGG